MQQNHYCIFLLFKFWIWTEKYDYQYEMMDLCDKDLAVVLLHQSCISFFALIPENNIKPWCLIWCPWYWQYRKSTSSWLRAVVLLHCSDGLGQKWRKSSVFSTGVTSLFALTCQFIREFMRLACDWVKGLVWSCIKVLSFISCIIILSFSVSVIRKLETTLGVTGKLTP